MPLIQLLEVLIVVGVLLWLVNRFIPMQGTIKSILNGVVVIAVVLWLLNVFGLFHTLSRIHVGRDALVGKAIIPGRSIKIRQRKRQTSATRRHFEESNCFNHWPRTEFERVCANQSNPVLSP